jgi:hypothetical protein
MAIRCTEQGKYYYIPSILYGLKEQTGSKYGHVKAYSFSYMNRWYI